MTKTRPARGLPEQALHTRAARAPLPPRQEPAPDDAGGMTEEQLVEALRALPGLVDVGRDPPNFQFRGQGFLHFHEHERGTYADVNFGSGDFEQVWAASPQERAELLARVCDHIESLERSRKPKRGRSERRRAPER